MQNCDGSKVKYLLENPDVKSAGMDAWAHYQAYGEREGRKWPGIKCDTAPPTAS